MTLAPYLALLELAVSQAAIPPTAQPQAERPQPALGEGLRERLPEDWRWLTDFTIAGNELWRVMGLFVAILIALIVGRVARYVLTLVAERRAAHSRNLVAVMMLAIARAAVFVSVVVGICIGLGLLALNPSVRSIAASVQKVLVTTAVGYVAYCLVDVVDRWLSGIAAKTASKLDDMLAPLVSKSLRGTVVVLVLAQIATYLSEKPVTSIIAGLGVGGLAVGLAAQDTIKNFFGSMMIFGDRPFEMGDTIIVDSNEGTVETVGFRSTRFRTGDGYLVAIPNGELASKTIINVSKRPRLSRKLSLSLPYDTPLEKVQQAVAIVREVLKDHEGQPESMPARVFFSDFSPTALLISAAYWYAPADWWRFSEFNERVNLEIMQRFAAAGISINKPPAPAAPRPSEPAPPATKT